MGIFIEYFWHLAALLVFLGLVVAHFYVKGAARNVIRFALVGVVLLGFQTYLQGTWMQRWQVRPVSEQEEALAQRLKSVPTTIGDWDSVDSPIDERGLQGSRTVGFYGREFRNRNNPDEVVSVYVFCGHPVDMTQHTPDQCYPLNGNEQADEQVKYVIETGKMAPDFYTSRFHKSTAFEGSQQVRVFWSFSSDGKWVAEGKLFSTLLNAPAIYKIYAITEVNGEGRNRPEDSAALPFLREFMPVLNAALFPPVESSPATSPDKPVAAATNG